MIFIKKTLQAWNSLSVANRVLAMQNINFFTTCVLFLGSASLVVERTTSVVVGTSL